MNAFQQLSAVRAQVEPTGGWIGLRALQTFPKNMVVLLEVDPIFGGEIQWDESGRIPKRRRR